MKNDNNVEIRIRGRVGDTKNGWEYGAIYPIESPSTGILSTSTVEVFENHFLLKYSKHGARSTVFYGLEDFKDFEIADKRAHEQALDLATEILGLYIKQNAGVKIVDTTERGKANQLEAKSKTD